MYFESVEVKKKKVDDFESKKIYNSLLTKNKLEPIKELMIKKVPKDKRLSYQLGLGLLKFNKNKLTEKNILND
jgi:hypothetical protein